MQGMVPLYGFGGGSGGTGATLTVTAPAGCTVTVSKDGKTKTKAAGTDGAAVFKGLSSGEWALTITDGDQTRTRSVTITADYSAVIAFFTATIQITYPEGSACTASDGNRMLSAPDTSGTWECVVPNAGTWTVTGTDGDQVSSRTAGITSEGQIVSITLTYNRIPEFTYTGEYEIVNDADEPITTSEDNWKIRFLTSGTLTFTALNGAENGIDVFLVGGGGGGPGSGTSYGGGGGGYTRTEKGVAVSVLNEYAIGIGAGGGTSVNGGTSSAFGLEASGGYKGVGSQGGAGGSGGAGEGYESIATDGANGAGSNGGKGQGTTTREFAEENGRLYASGGTGTNNHANKNPIYPNTGDGGHCGGTYVAGSSGIVIIRNAREVA